MAKYQINIEELIALVTIAQNYLSRNDVCMCEYVEPCFNCETAKLLRKIHRQTGIAITIPEFRKSKVGTPQPEPTM